MRSSLILLALLGCLVSASAPPSHHLISVFGKWLANRRSLIQSFQSVSHPLQLSTCDGATLALGLVMSCPYNPPYSKLADTCQPGSTCALYKQSLTADDMQCLNGAFPYLFDVFNFPCADPQCTNVIDDTPNCTVNRFDPCPQGCTRSFNDRCRPSITPRLIDWACSGCVTRFTALLMQFAANIPGPLIPDFTHNATDDIPLDALETALCSRDSSNRLCINVVADAGLNITTSLESVMEGYVDPFALNFYKSLYFVSGIPANTLSTICESVGVSTCFRKIVGGVTGVAYANAKSAYNRCVRWGLDRCEDALHHANASQVAWTRILIDLCTMGNVTNGETVEAAYCYSLPISKLSPDAAPQYYSCATHFALNPQFVQNCSNGSSSCEAVAQEVLPSWGCCALTLFGDHILHRCHVVNATAENKCLRTLGQRKIVKKILLFIIWTKIKDIVATLVEGIRQDLADSLGISTDDLTNVTIKEGDYVIAPSSMQLRSLSEAGIGTEIDFDLQASNDATTQYASDEVDKTQFKFLRTSTILIDAGVIPPDTQITGSAPPSDVAPSTTDNADQTKIIVGATVGGAAALLIVVGVAMYLRQASRKKRCAEVTDETPLKP